MKITIESSESIGLAPVSKESDLTTIDGGMPSEALLHLEEAVARANEELKVITVNGGVASADILEEYKTPPTRVTETESIDGGAAPTS